MIKKVTIVGGGTAGWSAAAILSANTELNIVIIDPSSIPIIGVGESTIPHILLAHRAMGFDELLEQNWLDYVDGTIKLTIEFADFNRVGEKWIHPFFDANGFDKNLFKRIDKYNYPNTAQAAQQEFIETHSVLGKLRTQDFISNDQWFKRSDASLVAAYHINAVKYVELLKQKTLQRKNVVYLDKSVKEVVLDESGSIKHLRMEDDTTTTSDLFVDCTGFSAILSSKVGSEWQDASSRLFVDGALVQQVPFINKQQQLRNTTYCHALSSGWVFNIPLQSRVGTGYIVSTKYQDKDNAIKEFAKHLRTAYGYNESDIQPRWIPFKTGYRPKAWTKNVVAIGLSGMFCEPIESTAIATGHMAAISLANALKAQHIELDMLVSNFNESFEARVRNILTFVELHYTLSKRQDSEFWKAYSNLGLTAEQTQIIEDYKNSAKHRVTFSDALSKYQCTKGKLFDSASFICLFAGYDIHKYN